MQLIHSYLATMFSISQFILKLLELKMFNAYSDVDPRRWTVLVDPGYHSVYITCFTNKEEKGDVLFVFDDGGNNFNKGFYLKTNSIEVVINQLIDKGINNNPSKNPFSRIK